MENTPGLWEKGGPSPNPSGRPRLPDWLRDKAPELIRLQLTAALEGRIPLAPPGPNDAPELTDDGEEIPPEETQIVPPKTRLAAAEALLNRMFGKAPIAVEMGEDAASVLAAILRDKG